MASSSGILVCLIASSLFEEDMARVELGQVGNPLYQKSTQLAWTKGRASDVAYKRFEEGSQGCIHIHAGLTSDVLPITILARLIGPKCPVYCKGSRSTNDKQTSSTIEVPGVLP